MRESRVFGSRRIRPVFVAVLLACLCGPIGSFASDAMPVSPLPDFDPPLLRHAALPTPWEDDALSLGFQWATPGVWKPHRKRVRTYRFAGIERLRLPSRVVSPRPEAVSVLALSSLSDSMWIGRPPPRAALVAVRPGASRTTGVQT